MCERFTDQARKVMQFANQEANKFNHEYIGTEHILLGLARENSCFADGVFGKLGIDPRKIRIEVEKIIQAGPGMKTMGKLPQTPRAKVVIAYAVEEARNLRHNYIGTEHLLLGLIRELHGVAAQVLDHIGVTYEAVRVIIAEFCPPSDGTLPVVESPAYTYEVVVYRKSSDRRECMFSQTTSNLNLKALIGVLNP